MIPTPQNQIHHLKESLEENSFKRKVPLILLLAFLVLVALGSLVYVYQYRDLPRCQDEAVQILLNQNIRNNEGLIQNSQTLAFNGFKEVMHKQSQRSCNVTLITNQSNYSVAYFVVSDLSQKNWLSRLTGTVDYSVMIEKIEPTQLR
jgi:cell division protein FtsL